MNSKQSQNSLIEYLKQIPDFRDPRGCRHPLWLVLLLVIMGMMSGYYGYRDIGRFVERHRWALSKALKIGGAQVPSYSTIRRVMMGVDYTELRATFNQWASQELALPSGEWLALDGKSLKNTVSHYDQAEQNFISFVSVFSQQRGVVVGVQEMENKNESEINVVRNLLESLSLKGYVLSLDALHCHSKPLRTSSTVVMTICSKLKKINQNCITRSLNTQRRLHP